MITEVSRERSSIAATLLATLMLLMAISLTQLVTSPVQPLRTLTTGEMVLVQGEGLLGEVSSISAIVAGAVAVGLAVVCVANPVAGAIIVSTVLGSGIPVWGGAAILGFGGAGLIAGGILGLSG